MTQYFMYAILLFGLFGLVSGIVALRKSQHKKTILARPYKPCEFYGSFVWADHVLFGPFWFLISLAVFFLNDVLLFALIYFLFWSIRSFGETIYWFIQQFSPRPGNEPELFWINRHVPGEAVWFLHQIFWQCILVLSIVLTIFFAHAWLTHLP